MFVKNCKKNQYDKPQVYHPHIFCKVRGKIMNKLQVSKIVYRTEVFRN